MAQTDNLSCDQVCLALGLTCNGDFTSLQVSGSDITLMSQTFTCPNGIFTGSLSDIQLKISPAFWADSSFNDCTTQTSDSLCSAVPPNSNTVRRFCPCAVGGGSSTDSPTVNPTESPTVNPTESPTVNPTASPTTSLSGDPHLVGFKGQRFDLFGKEDTEYSLIQDDRIQLNARTNKPYFEHVSDVNHATTYGKESLFMTAVSLAFLDESGTPHTLIVEGDFNSTVHGNERYCGWRNHEQEKCARGIQMIVDGDLLVRKTGPVDLTPDVTIRIQNNDCHFKQHRECSQKSGNGGYGMVSVESPSLKIEVGAIFMNNHDVMGKTLHHLDLSLTDYYPAGAPRGLLGQTVEFQYDDLGNPIRHGPRSIAGHEDDYIVTGFDLGAFISEDDARHAGASFSAFASGLPFDESSE